MVNILFLEEGLFQFIYTNGFVVLMQFLTNIE